MTITKDPVHLQLYARAPAPCRDYYGLTVTSNLVILNIWNISHGPHVYPKRQKSHLSDFHEDKYLQGEIRRLFGEHVLVFAIELARQERNLKFLPTQVFLRILRLLAANDILRLSQTSKIFFEICNSEAAWKIIFRKRVKRRILFQDSEKAESVGWRAAIREKICNTMYASKNILPKQTSTNNNKSKITSNAKPSNVNKNVNKQETGKNLTFANNRIPSTAMKKVTNAKAQEINNKTPLVHSVARKQEIDIIKNVIKDVKPKATKSAGQLRTINEKSDIKKANVSKNSPVRNVEKLNSQTKLKVPINRSQINAAKVPTKSPDTGDGLKNILTHVLKSNLNKKVVCKSALISKDAVKPVTKY